MTTERRNAIGRRSFLLSLGSLAATPLLGGMATQAVAQAATSKAPATTEIGRRRLGKLEVSSIGLGVQNMSRTYHTTIPSRPEMINIIRTAFDRGVTFFDAAEAYGPHEVERILGEGIAPFRDKVAITSKFGWNIDLETGERRPGSTAARPTSSWPSKACSSDFGRTASISSTSTGSIQRSRSRTSPARSRT